MAYQELHCAGRGGLESYFKVILSMHPQLQQLGLCVNSRVWGHGSGYFWFPGIVSQEKLRGENIMLQRTLMCCYSLSGGSYFPTLIHTTTWGKLSAVLFSTCPSDSAPCGTVQSLLGPSAWKSKPCVWYERAPKNLVLISSVISFPEPGFCLD